MRLTLFVACFASGCCAQFQQTHTKHVKTDHNSATITKESVQRLRDPACRADAKCLGANLGAIDEQADAILVNP
jgi:hypothetical protein